MNNYEPKPKANEDQDAYAFNSGFPDTPMLEMNVGDIGLGLDF